MTARIHDYSQTLTIEESVELDRCRREGKERPPYADMATIRAWLVEQRLRWAKEGHPDYQHSQNDSPYCSDFMRTRKMRNEDLAPRLETQLANDDKKPFSLNKGNAAG